MSEKKKVRQCGEKKSLTRRGTFFFWDIFLDAVFGRLKANHEVNFFFFLIPSPEEQSGFSSEPAIGEKTVQRDAYPGRANIAVVASADTAPPRGMEQATQTAKKQ